MKKQFRARQLFPPTLRQEPSEAATPGHKLLVRAGFVHQVAAGIYTLGPLAMRVLTKIEDIVRDEMNVIDGLEVHFPILQPRELWDRTLRWPRYIRDGIMFHLTDRKGIEFGISPTAEEVATIYAGYGLLSYTQLPLTVYQIEWKGRDELRPRMGLLRCREFRMKDSYSFDVDESAMRKSYERHRQAYDNMFRRMGFNFISVQADSGAIGGQGSAEFMAISGDGEDVLLTCDNCGYGANLQKAESLFVPHAYSAQSKPIHKEHTPNARTVEELERYFGLTARDMVKTIIYVADGQPVLVCCRGDLQINEVKLGNILNASALAIATDEVVQEVTRAPVGFAGPINLFGNYRIIFDVSAQAMTNFLCGCNETDYHMLDVNFGRDIPKPERFYDVHNAVSGDSCVNCGGTLRESRGIELGHIFMLQQGYAEKLEISFSGQDGKPHVPWMGCYGVGTTRCLQALAEQFHDADGLMWPKDMAPFTYAIVPAGPPQSAQYQLAEELFEQLSQRRQEVMLDDRDLAFGAKMKDALLLGFPHIVVVGREAGARRVELQTRATGEKVALDVAEFLERP